MSKTTVDVADADAPLANPEKPFQCARCQRNFKTSQGRSIHLHKCKGSESATAPIIAKSSPMDDLCKMNNLTAKESKPYMKKLVHWFMLRKMGEFKRGVRSYNAFKCYKGKHDLELKARLRKAASSILACLTGDHSTCSYSFVCKDSCDPYIKCLPHCRNIPVLPKSVQILLRESLWDIFSAMKLDSLIRNSKIHTTSHVEAVHRTIRNAAPKNKPLFSNETPVLQMGAAIAGSQGKGKATLRHLRAMKVEIGDSLAAHLRRIDRHRKRHSEYRKSVEYKTKEAQRRRRKFLQHAAALESKERDGYRKEGFQDHTYSAASSKSASSHCVYLQWNDSEKRA